MIKLRTDDRTPTLTAEQFSTLRDTLYLFLGGESLSFMGKIFGGDFLQAMASGHTHAQYLESVAWSIITGKPSTFPPEAHTHSQYLESVSWSIITGKPATYPPETHTHNYYLTSAGASWIGDGTGARTINLNSSGTLTFIQLYSWSSTSFQLLFWTLTITAGNLVGLNQNGSLILFSVWESNNNNINITTSLNASDWNYRVFVLRRSE